MSSDATATDINDSDATLSKVSSEPKIKCKTKYLLGLFSSRGEKIDFQAYPTNPTSTQCTDVASYSFGSNDSKLLATSPDFVAYVMKDDLIRVIDLNYAASGVYHPHEGQILDLSFSQSSSPRLASTATDSLLLIATLDVESTPEQTLFVKTSHVIGVRRVHGLTYSKIVWHPTNPSILATLGSEGSLHIWNVDRIPLEDQGIYSETDLADAHHILSTNLQGASDLSFSSDGERIVCVSQAGQVTAWDWKLQKHVFTFHPHVDEGTCYAYLFSGKFSDQSDATQVSGDYLITVSNGYTALGLALFSPSSPSPKTQSTVKLENTPARGFSISFQPSIPALLLADQEEPFIYAVRIGLGAKDPKKAPTPQDVFFLSSTKFYITKTPASLSVSTYEPSSDDDSTATDPANTANGPKLLCTFTHAEGVSQAEIIPSNFKTTEKSAAGDKSTKPDSRPTTPSSKSKASQPVSPSSSAKGTPVVPQRRTDIPVEARPVQQPASIPSVPESISFTGPEVQDLSSKKLGAQLNEVGNRISNLRKDLLEGVRKEIISSMESQIEKSIESIMTKKMNQQIKSAIQSQFDTSAPTLVRTITDNIRQSLATLSNAPSGASSADMAGVVASSTKAAVSDVSGAMASVINQRVAAVIDQKMQEMLYKLSAQSDALHAKIRSENQDMVTMAMANVNQQTAKVIASEMAKVNQAMVQIQSSIQTINEQMKTLRQSAPGDQRSCVADLIKSENYLEAFHIATSLADEHFLINLCQETNEEVVCNALKGDQAVLLSLIQQLSFHIEEELELRICWLTECLMGVDVSDPVVAMNGGVVLNDVLAALMGLSESGQNAHKRMVSRAKAMLESFLRRLQPVVLSS